MVLALAIGSSSICCLSEPREQHAMSDYETLLVRTSHAVMTVTLSNPPINLETDAMMADLDRLVALLEADRETKVVVFRSDAPGYFMAHFDVAPGAGRVLPPLGAALLHTRISHLDQVTIGELRGRARSRQRIAAGARHAFRFAREGADRPAGNHSRPTRRGRWHRVPRAVDGPGAAHSRRP
jgi:hypothetical protein